MQRAMFATVDEVGTACDAEGIDAHYCKGGSLTVAVDAPQAERIAGMLEEDRSFGFGEEDSSWLDAEATRARLDVAGAVGAMFTPHCARVHPSRLARGLADAVERRGVALFERTPVVGTDDRVLITPHGRLRADVVVWATEGYGGRTAPRGRDVAPVYTYMVATEPMPSAFWDEVGWSGYECVGDGPRLYLYAQRTDDDRIAIGGGALRYPFASRARPSMDHAPTVFRQIARILVRRWPAAAGARLTHAWGGPCGMSRDWFPSVGVDRTRGFAWGGGYVGDGVAASNLAGRTLADLILDRDTDLVRLPWVGHRWPRWEPEPLRWLGVRSGIGLARVADLVESRSGRVPHLLDVAMDRLAGP
jgi:glycine/D-amino acid oxidase-like deaminating enzyme